MPLAASFITKYSRWPFYVDKGVVLFVSLDIGSVGVWRTVLLVWHDDVPRDSVD